MADQSTPRAYPEIVPAGMVDFRRTGFGACYGLGMTKLCPAAKACSLELACALSETSHGNHLLAQRHAENAHMYACRIANDRVRGRASVLVIKAAKIVGVVL